MTAKTTIGSEVSFILYDEVYVGHIVAIGDGVATVSARVHRGTFTESMGVPVADLRGECPCEGCAGYAVLDTRAA